MSVFAPVVEPFDPADIDPADLGDALFGGQGDVIAAPDGDRPAWDSDHGDEWDREMS